MSRQEDFQEQAKKYANECGGTTQEKCATMTDYFAGCEHGYLYALQHPQWIPVEERLPEERGNYIVYARRKLVTDIICEAIFDSKFWYKQSSGAYLEVTHWMPLPAAPRKEE